MLVIKEFKTIDQQIDILRKKGLIIDDEARAYDILLKENYFFLNYILYFYLIDIQEIYFLRIC